jgi:hypothetical protein
VRVIIVCLFMCTRGTVRVITVCLFMCTSGTVRVITVCDCVWGTGER